MASTLVFALKGGSPPLCQMNRNLMRNGCPSTLVGARFASNNSKYSKYDNMKLEAQVGHLFSQVIQGEGVMGKHPGDLKAIEEAEEAKKRLSFRMGEVYKENPQLINKMVGLLTQEKLSKNIKELEDSALEGAIPGTANTPWGGSMVWKDFMKQVAADDPYLGELDENKDGIEENDNRKESKDDEDEDEDEGDEDEDEDEDGGKVEDGNEDEYDEDRDDDDEVDDEDEEESDDLMDPLSDVTRDDNILTVPEEAVTEQEMEMDDNDLALEEALANQKNRGCDGRCIFCSDERHLYPLEPMNVYLLTRFMTSAGFIKTRKRNGLCRKMQSRVVRTISHARALGLFSYKGGVWTIRNPLEIPTGKSDFKSDGVRQYEYIKNRRGGGTVNKELEEE